MKYVCLFYQDENVPQEELAKVHQEWTSFPAYMQQTGQVIRAEGFEPTSGTTTVRVRDGKTLTTDGPFIETKEQLGGLFIIEAKDLNEAIRFASKIPTACVGAVEVRQAWEGQ